MQQQPIVVLDQLSRQYTTPSGPFAALRGVSLSLPRGKLVGIVGRSGSGKSTLLNVIAGIDRPSSGQVLVDGTDLGSMSEDALARWRGRSVGIVFQFFQLLPTLSVLDNVMLPMDFAGTLGGEAARARALELLTRVGIADQAAKLPAALSGGQQQRAAIARALANKPALLVADEPTGNLDSSSATAVLELLRAEARSGTSVLMVTHERDVSALVDHVVSMKDGTVAGMSAGRAA